MKHQQRSSEIGDVLVVDDDPMIVDMLIDFLDFEGYTARGASNGREGESIVSPIRTSLWLTVVAEGQCMN